jgi:hypothetical protein
MKEEREKDSSDTLNNLIMTSSVSSEKPWRDKPINTKNDHQQWPKWIKLAASEPPSTFGWQVSLRFLQKYYSIGAFLAFLVPKVFFFLIFFIFNPYLMKILHFGLILHFLCISLSKPFLIVKPYNGYKLELVGFYILKRSLYLSRKGNGYAKRF